MEETILSLQAGKSALNFLPFLFLRDVQNQTAFTSLLILTVTDTLITVFLFSLWIGGWQLSFSLETVALQFLWFQNETYRCITMLIPWVGLSEEWCRSLLHGCGRLTALEKSLSLQRSEEFSREHGSNRCVQRLLAIMSPGHKGIKILQV
ncbi:uncharacterized protein WCC33_018749 [Rhinophrynus dorsalis]